MELRESQLVEAVSEMINGGTLILADISLEKANQYEEIFSRAGYHTTLIPIFPKSSGLPVVCKNYQLNIKKMKTD